MKYFLFLLLIWNLLSCKDKIAETSMVKEDNNKNNNSNLYTKLSGRKFEKCLGKIEKGKTNAFFVTKENDVERRFIVDSLLKERNLYSEDSSQIKSIILIYHSGVYNSINGNNNLKDNELAICFLSASLFCIKKEIIIKRINNYNEMQKNISDEIINYLKEL